MTRDEFMMRRWKSGQQILFSNEIFDVIGIDWEGGSIGIYIQKADDGTATLQWIHYKHCSMYKTISS